MGKLLTVLICFLFLIIVETKYEIILDRVELPLQDEDQILKFHTYRVRKFNRSCAVLSGVLEYKMKVDNSVIISFEGFNFVAGQHKKIFGRTIGPFCDVVYEESFSKETRAYFSLSNFSVPFGTCPIPAQFVMIRDFTPDGLGEYLPPYIPGGERWKVILWFSKDDKVIGGFTVYAILRDNQKLFDSKFG